LTWEAERVLAFMLYVGLYPCRDYADLVRLYRERRRVALALPSEPYDIGHDWGRLRRLLDESQADPVLESARQHARREYRRFLIIASLVGPLVVGSLLVWLVTAVS
jgi:hypothetical protein